MKWALLFVAILAAAVFYAVFMAPSPKRDSASKASAAAKSREPSAAELAAKAEAEAVAKRQEEERRAAELAAKAAESERKAKDAVDAKRKQLAELQSEYAQTAKTLSDLAQKNFEDAVSGDDKGAALELKRQKVLASEALFAAQGVYSKAQNSASLASNELGGITRMKSEYKYWRYVGDSEMHPISELGNRDKRRPIQYVSGGQSTAKDAQAASASSAASAAKQALDSAKAAKEQAEKAYSDFASAYKKRLQTQLDDLKKGIASLSAELTPANP